MLQPGPRLFGPRALRIVHLHGLARRSAGGRPLMLMQIVRGAVLRAARPVRLVRRRAAEGRLLVLVRIVRRAVLRPARPLSLVLRSLVRLNLALRRPAGSRPLVVVRPGPLRPPLPAQPVPVRLLPVRLLPAQPAPASLARLPPVPLRPILAARLLAVVPARRLTRRRRALMA